MTMAKYFSEKFKVTVKDFEIYRISHFISKLALVACNCDLI